MARSNAILLAICAALAVCCYLGLRQNTADLQMPTIRIARNVAVHADLRYPKSALGSWGDAIKKNSQEKAAPRAPISKKTWWNCLDPKWKKGGAASASNSEAQQWINSWKTSVGK
mmetsp:Transcript_93/g.113  ORF Transcript_93/g.113 Transcript_93/m.113 type:complete len:115 (-) Transcript_93:213-557(-)|eukprot:CAMPEP_0184485166 /NCGR_PEP_ID=MMETSP0113_2-20130426/6812_1 /TAXON_ID=91329 /ORGANISM="Norrisiella sphaerica, Strain BC52" /LENGTH=114 /DNA_ID=CAMNT_0026866497 /DNA_START=87 /DNA_END=431 /DNA_ORIENTATION=+